MQDPSTRSSAGGGVLIALGAIIGAFGGAWAGEATIGFLAGTAIGIGSATLIWVLGRR